MSDLTCQRVTADISVDLQPSEQRQLLANNYLTETAAIALLRIIERTLIQPFTLSQLVVWLEQDPLPKGTFARKHNNAAHY
jgi:hypothetical protein